MPKIIVIGHLLLKLLQKMYSRVFWGHSVHCVSKNAPHLKRYSSQLIMINFDDIWQIYSEDSRIKSACFSFHVGFLFYQLFVLAGDSMSHAHTVVLGNGKI